MKPPGFAAMESALLKKGVKKPKKAPKPSMKPAPQFFTQAAGGDLGQAFARRSK